MASGITHILLMKELQNHLPDGKLKKILQSGRDFLQVGAVGPDLPYASIAAGSYIFGSQSELADKFHYEKTNELILEAFNRINTETKTAKEKRFMFSFFLGFASHIIADGIIHPFVRDKVGDYNENKTAHRILEMQLDVLLFYYITKYSNSPLDFNYTDLHKELINFYRAHSPEANKVLNLFSSLIKEIYNFDCKASEIENWVKGLFRMLDIAEGDHPKIYGNIGIIKSFLFSDFEDLKNKAKSIIELEKPFDRGVNFLNKKKVHFFDDCLPRFYKIFVPLAKKCYEYVYGEEGELTDSDLALIDLDTGRLIANNNLDSKPFYWS